MLPSMTPALKNPNPVPPSCIHRRTPSCLLAAALAILVAGSLLPCSAAQREKNRQSGLPSASPSSSMIGVTTGDILEKYVRALGGQAAVLRIQSRVVTGRMEMPSVELNVPWSQQAKAPNKKLTVIEMPGVGKIVEGFNGKIGWAQNPQAGLVNKAGEDLVKLRNESDFYRDLKLRDLFPQMAYLGVEKLNDQDTHVIEAKAPGSNPERLYFDRKTGLLMRKDFATGPAQARTLYRVVYDDFRGVDEVTIPFKVTVFIKTPKSEETSFTVKFTEVKHNVPISDELFEKPAKP
jgi:hypothetical protein